MPGLDPPFKEPNPGGGEKDVFISNDCVMYKCLKGYAASAIVAQSRELPMAWGSQRPHLGQDDSLDLDTYRSVKWKRGDRTSLAEGADF